MQRVRMSLPYFAACGWDAEVVTIDAQYADLAKDELLLQSLPPGIKVHKVKAFRKALTSKVGLGSIAIRSLWYYRKTVNCLLKDKKFDLIYFSTTQFPVCTLGAYWKKRFGVPYVIDMQDPWHSDYYINKPKSDRPPKYWFAYRLNKYLEPIAIKNASGIISVSAGYIDQLKLRYPVIQKVPTATITFGAFEPDLQIAKTNQKNFAGLLNDGFINVVYIGRGGKDLHKAISPVFDALRTGLNTNKERFDKIKLHFIGTSYAPAGQGIATILPLAKQYDMEEHLVEIIDRISYYQALLTLQQADALFIPGSDDPKYTASKIFPYLLTKRPVLAVFNAASSAIPIMQQYGVEHVYNYDDVTSENLFIFFEQLIKGNFQTVEYNADAIEKYSALEMTLAQCRLFDRIIYERH
ncbi:Glycosyl transferase 4-like domain-containing protein [Mucilaginibacter gossypii]|uniref:Glycosyl transferase 4-like domain-containing protein n=2 Tax=Mucilaginibacter gossypii TaxID=551996 RepID=A0A1G8IVB6_9SPHI|nr:Glycosyl transferase 4-like domain-containing protein [Mucilaginibacter gossypii]